MVRKIRVKFTSPREEGEMEGAQGTFRVTRTVCLLIRAVVTEVVYASVKILRVVQLRCWAPNALYV